MKKAEDLWEVRRTGWFVNGNLMNWDMSPPGVVRIDEQGRVLVNGVEIVEWTELRKKSEGGKSWIKA
jgi:hypothetical protein